jgi:hypothetical protein
MMTELHGGGGAAPAATARFSLAVLLALAASS